MSRFRITESTTKELVVDLEQLKEEFYDEWGWNVAEGFTTEDFIQELVNQYGLDGIEESLPDGRFSRVYGELNIENDE